MIRQTTNIRLVKHLHKRCFPEDHWDPRGQHWIAWEGDWPIGFCTARPIIGEAGCFFSWAGVLPAYKGRGLHRKMIKVRLRWAQKYYPWVITYALRSNHESIANLIRCGFTIYEPEYKWGGKDAMYFLKDFAK